MIATLLAMIYLALRYRKHAQILQSSEDLQDSKIEAVTGIENKILKVCDERVWFQEWDQKWVNKAGRGGDEGGDVPEVDWSMTKRDLDGEELGAITAADNWATNARKTAETRKVTITPMLLRDGPMENDESGNNAGSAQGKKPG